MHSIGGAVAVIVWQCLSVHHNLTLFTCKGGKRSSERKYSERILRTPVQLAVAPIPQLHATRLIVLLCFTCQLSNGKCKWVVALKCLIHFRDIQQWLSVYIVT